MSRYAFIFAEIKCVSGSILHELFTNVCGLCSSKFFHCQQRLSVSQHRFLIPLQLNPRRISHYQIKPAPALKHIRKLQLPVEELLLLRHLIGDAQARETRPELIEVHRAVFAVAVGELPGIRVKIKIIEHGNLNRRFSYRPLY